jgi:hypothetical protein
LFRWLTLTIMLAMIMPPRLVAAAALDDPIVPSLRADVAVFEQSLGPVQEFHKIYLSVRNARGPVSETDLSTLRTRSTDLKRQFLLLERASASLMAKFKAANKWNAALDAEIERRMRAANVAAEFVSYLRELGGFRAAVERGARMAGEAGRQVDLDVAALQKKTVAERALDALLGARALAACIRCHCLWFAVGAAAALATGIGAGVAFGLSVGGLACSTAR